MKQSNLVILAVCLIVIAAVLISFQVKSSHSGVAVKVRTTEEQIADIQNNTHMPDDVKQIAIGQIKAHAGGQQAPLLK